MQTARDFLLGGSTKKNGRPNRRDEPASRKKPSRSTESAHAASTTSDDDAPDGLDRLDLSARDIRRTDSGWRARCIHKRGVDSRHVNDARYGGYVGSFMEALDVRDGFYRQRGLPIPWQVEAVVDGERVAPEIVRVGDSIVVRWQGQEHEVSGDDAEEIATEIALDLFVEFLENLQALAHS